MNDLRTFSCLANTILRFCVIILQDVEALVGELPNVVDQFLVEYQYFNHLDFLLAKNVKSLVYDRVISVIQRVSPV